MTRVAIVDYGVSNVDSVRRALEECGARPFVVSDGRDLKDAAAIILPGIGSFTEGVRRLQERGLREALSERVLEKKVPFLGICLGMQLIAAAGAEGGGARGLNWLPGTTQRLVPVSPTERIPHVGWNDVVFKPGALLGRGIPSGTDFYFTHSFHFDCKEPAAIAARTPYCGEFVSAVARDNIFGVQFHPEKSQRAGFSVLRNFLTL